MTYSGILARSRGLALLAALSAAAALPALRSAEAVSGYDGVWSVVIFTKEQAAFSSKPGGGNRRAAYSFLLLSKSVMRAH